MFRYRELDHMAGLDVSTASPNIVDCSYLNNITVLRGSLLPVILLLKVRIC
jgi:hypothetical protein